MKFLDITKLQAAERQIETAAKLYFNDGDSISVHTLSEAGHNILIDLAISKDMTVPRHVSLDQIKPEYKKEFSKMLRVPQNFFKHADKDPEEILSFNPHLNELSLLYAILLFKQFSDSPPFFMKSFIVYYQIHNPKAFLDFNKDSLQFAKELEQVSK